MSCWVQMNPIQCEHKHQKEEITEVISEAGYHTREC